MKIFIATANKHKKAELLKILPTENNKGEKFEYFTFLDFPSLIQPEETALTLKENALIKAKSGLAQTGLATLADDTGLMVDALNGAPGVFSARYAFKDKADYEANNIKLLSELEGLPKEKRTARFKTICALALPSGEIIIKEGAVEGYITQDYFGTQGFGYDPIFEVKELGKTMAALTTEEKNKISHRGHAFSQIVPILKEL
ncbi:MAG: RdgB/HAM1 family non-canonical purine NTP pyrophosphatase [Elusimicrobiaceae bacterium]|nr:RdgB/HAM1 family non-canonical purine NTP pyrophosphatase [Elusimicrobiaceae bacterium]